MLEKMLGCFAPFIYYKQKLVSLSGKKRETSVRVLMYHDVPAISMTNFKVQLLFLKNHYNICDPVSFFKFLLGEKELEGQNILITFDDGFKSNRLVAENLLGPMGIKALFFVPSGFINCSERAAQESYITEKIYHRHVTPEELNQMAPMNWDDLRCLLSEGHVIGAHTLNHISVNSPDVRVVEEEIFQSGRVLTQKLGVAIDSFAYPFGQIKYVNGPALNIIKKYFKFCFSGVRGENTKNTSPYAICREAVSPDSHPRYLQFIVEGGLDWRYKEKVELLQQFEKM